MKFLLVNFVKQKLFIDIFFLLVIFILTYWKVPSIFFQQDEWLGFGIMIAQKFGSPVNLGIDFHFVPVNLFLANLLFTLFGLNYVIYNFIGLFFHLINAILVYLISLKIIQRRTIALVSGVLFITSGAASQLIMWPVVSIGTLSLVFTLLVWRILLEDRLRKTIIGSLLIAILMIMAFLTVEYSMGLLLFIPVAYLLLNRKAVWREKMIFFSPILILNFIYFLVRAKLMIWQPNININKLTEVHLLDFVSKLFYLPIKYLSQLLIPESILVNASYLFTKDSVEAETIVFHTLTIGIGIIIMAVILYFLFVSSKYRKLGYLKLLIMVLLFLFSSSLPFLLLPAEAGNFFIFPPRYLYFGIAGIAVLFGVMLKISLFVKEFNFYFSKLFKILLIVAVFFMITVGLGDNWRRETMLGESGKTRENILNTIQKLYPSLTAKVIFYITSDSYYYSQEEIILPFQSGLGQTLLVWYYKENFGRNFYEDKFLWEITSQGYKEVGDRGFGYFRDYNLLKETINKYQIPVESVIVFSWEGENKNLFNITNGMREKIEQEVYE